ncbi:hypothetical protein ACW0FU_004286 [Vibrio vulnificus]|uniref:hypothetical protein n=1 Tax=Vibrio vulnificus TaxID=672 RepID=UPI00057805D4|nr:hypothetical protein [Vibrio vulnificus]ELE1909268.1 hypothetical protein [Vibrio vulnificus]MCU8186034.1 hypothetical protein [Vibrio vulnificus]MCU8360834.1 hypothetical protein [Vibrio vulnificus]HAS6938606.1 hypothetical protein [Vibrio vulnificus]
MLERIFHESLNDFFQREANNILSGVAERNLCSRLAMQLEPRAMMNGLAGYYADTEYNRKQNGKVKTILDDDMQVVVINCDLILHSRGEIMGRDNLIAIEMKKSERPEAEKVSDRARLRTMTKPSFDDIWSFDGETHPEHVCGYELGYFIEINRQNREYIVQKFAHGELVESITREF